MSLGTRAPLAAGLLAAAAIATGCGSGSGARGLLSQADSATLSAQLSTLSSDVSSGACRKARATLSRLNDAIAGLPSDTSDTVVQSLSASAQTVKSDALSQCRKPPATTTTSTSTTSSTPTVSSTPTTPSTPTATPTQSVTQTHTVTQSQTGGGVGTGGVTSLASPTTTNGGAGLNPGGQ